MLSRLALASLMAIGFEGCFAQISQESTPQFPDIKPVVSSQLPAADLTTTKPGQWNAAIEQPASSPRAENSQPLPVKLPLVQESIIENPLPLNESQLYGANPLEPVKQGSYMTLTSTGSSNALGNPLYQMNLYANGRLLHTYVAVSGRAHTQKRNRNKSGTQAPLPDGRYSVAKSAVPGTNSEVGGRFLHIQPLFSTGRSALGIHYDPSFEKSNGEDGTEGCIALSKKQELSNLLNYVRTYRPKYLEVNI